MEFFGARIVYRALTLQEGDMLAFLGLTIGFYSYSILIIGLFGFLSFYPVLFLTFLFALPVLYRLKFYFPRLTKFQSLLLLIILLTALVNLVGALGPEIAFDALWYHLTIPRVFLMNESVFFIEGGLFYYSLMPKLTEMLYTAALLLSGEITAKLIHFSFGLLTCAALYKLAREFVSKNWAILAVIVFYSNLVVAWLSITSYVDLSRAFFETLALLFMVRSQRKESVRDLYSSAVFVGFAICSKLISVLSLPIYAILLIKYDKKQLFTFLTLATITALPWFLVSLFYTGNPIYPLFSIHSPKLLHIENFELVSIFKNLLQIFLFAPDPLSPIYLIIAPFGIALLKVKKFRLVITYCLGSILLWYIATFSGLWHATDQAGSARFMTAYLPALSVLVVGAISLTKSKYIQRISIGVIIVISLITICYRGIANARFLPVILGAESREEFLLENLNFDFGDFYDENKNIQNIVGDKKVLIQGIHNLYYVDFNFTLSDWKDSHEALYLLIREDPALPSNEKANFIYSNQKTNVKLYRL